MDTSQKKQETENILSDEFYQTIFMQAGDGIFLIDDQGVIVEANPRGCEILGYTHDELCGLPVMKLHPADEIDHVIAGLGQLAVEKCIVIESAFIRGDGVRIPVEITGRLLSNNHIVGLLRDISERKKAEQATQELISTDSLTGLYNRRHFFSIANVILSEVVRYRQPASILLLDLDHFKNINDTHGHMKGDLALQHLAGSIRSITRASDVAARFGGDEFVLLLPQTDEEQALHTAKRLQEHLAQNPIPNIEAGFFITLSIGITSARAPYQSVSIDTLLEQADQALYKAKQLGRNKTCAWSTISAPVYRQLNIAGNSIKKQ